MLTSTIDCPTPEQKAEVQGIEWSDPRTSQW